MKKIAALLLLFSLSGCAYNSVTITADNGSKVTCTSSVDKPVDVSTALKGNVPLQGGSVEDNGANVAE